MKSAGPLLLSVLLLVSSSCGRIVFNTPTHREGDGWQLTLAKVRDGPNQVGSGNFGYVPGAGNRFIWTHITLRNPSAKARTFSFDRCDLDNGDAAVVPTAIAMDLMGGAGLMDREPELAADEKLTRWLVFSYPQDRSPTRLYCAPMKPIAMPQF